MNLPTAQQTDSFQSEDIEGKLSGENETPSRSVERLIRELLPEENSETHIAILDNSVRTNTNRDASDNSLAEENLSNQEMPLENPFYEIVDETQTNSRITANKRWRYAVNGVSISLNSKCNKVANIDESSHHNDSPSVQFNRSDHRIDDENDGTGSQLQPLPTSNDLESQNETNAPEESRVHYLTPLHQYFETTHLFGLSPYQPHQNYSRWNWSAIFKQASSGIVAVFSFLHGMEQIKSFAIHESFPNELYRYTMTGFFVVHLFSKVYLDIVLWFDQQKMNQLLNTQSGLYEKIPKETLAIAEAKWKSKWYRRAFESSTITFIAVGVIPFILSMFRGVFEFYQLNDWSTKTCLKYSAYRLGRFLFVWGTGDLTDATKEMESELMETNGSAGWISLGLFGLALNICGSLQEYALRDLLMMIAMSMSTPCHVFRMITKRVEGKTLSEEDSLANPMQFDENWEYYESLRKTSQETNKCFGPLMRSIHINNMLLIACFILLCITQKHTEASFILYLYNIGKILYTYYISAQIAQTNDSARTWIKACAKHETTIEIAGIPRNVQSLLDDIRQVRIGIGTGQFHVNESFLMRFFGMTSSLLVFLVEAEGDNDYGIDNENEDNE